jgi:hypothetical protein
MLNKVYFSVLLTYLFSTACATRAPTQYELDRRAGLSPSEEVSSLEETDLRKLALTQKDPKHPIRRPAQLEKVWVYDQELDGGYWMQGTFVYLEVSPGEWTMEEIP